MVNEEFEPSDDMEKVLTALKNGRKAGEPWGRANPMFLREETGLEKSKLEYALRRLDDAGWIDRPAEGLYELVDDPRE